MKKIANRISVFILGIFICLCACSCGHTSTMQADVFEIYKFKGYKVAKKLVEGSTDYDHYILKNDSIAINLQVPAWFSDLYEEGDTIK